MNRENKHFSTISANKSYLPEKPIIRVKYSEPILSDTNHQEHTEKVKKSKTGFRIFCFVLFLVVVFSTGIGVGILTKKSDSDSGGSLNNPINDFVGAEIDITVNSKPDTSTEDNSGKMSISKIFEFVSPSIVEINIYSHSDKTGTVAASYSSGIIMSADGYILSNDHIYGEVSNPIIYVTVGSEMYKATFVAGDSRRDVSVLKIEAENLKPAVFGKSSELVIGEDVYAIGNPAELENSITNGIVSSLDRRVSNSQGQSEVFIQTNAAISGGSSGGALVNEFGQVVGITSSKYVSSGVEGISFAIPIDNALSMVQDLLKNGKVTTRAKLGIKYVEMNIAEAELSNCPVGIVFYSADKNSNLYNSGISEGDIITEINGTKITNSVIVLDMIAAAKPGDSVTLKVWSAKTGEYKTYTASLLADEGSSSYIPPSLADDNKDDKDTQSDRKPLFPEDEE